MWEDVDVVTGVAQGVAALAGMGKITGVRSRADRIQNKIESRIVLLGKLPEESTSRQALVDHIDGLTVQMISEESDSLSIKRRWDSIFLAVLGVSGFGVWAWSVSTLWQEVVLWILAGLFGVSLFGLTTTSRYQKRSEPSETPASSTGLRRSGKDIRAAS